MKLLDKCWALVIYVLDLVTLSTNRDRPLNQLPLDVDSHFGQGQLKGPVFSPPNAPDGFFCDYSAMRGWRKCSTPRDRGCWLTNGTHQYDITTDYELDTPTGVTRKYTLDVEHMTISPDGYQFEEGKVFNGRYPGPWITACWGDDLEIKVTNHLNYNGTTVHWHGIRQLHSMEMDGVNGVTQCPIAGNPVNDSFTYRFKALQYGTTWYHSHYSLQYGDGLAGPMTLFGPSSSNYDEAIEPILMTDWNHQSAFEMFWEEITPGKGPPRMQNILLNGIGQYKCTDAESQAGICQDGTTRYTMKFRRGKRYLLRLINTSVDTTFIFAIDHHKITVMSSDFVPIYPYVTDSVLVGIGQRYHVVVEAEDVYEPSSMPRNYWIRTVAADKCNTFDPNNLPDYKTGILCYEGSDCSILPNSTISQFPTACSDEPYESLRPVVPWTIGRPANEQEKSTFAVGIATEKPPPVLPPGGLNFSRWEMGKQSLWLNFSDPTIRHVHTGRTSWPPELVVVPQNYANDSWVYLLVTTTGFPFGNINRNFVPASHPIHLHGHDFAILQQSASPYWSGLANLTLQNPPRRDVALLPSGGYLLLAFKSDNPGSWLMHCHIAWHASAGLAVQILERDPSIVIGSESMAEAERVCDNWNRWYGNKANLWDAHAFQDDSGI